MKYLKSYKLFESTNQDYYSILNQVISVYAFTIIGQQLKTKEFKLNEFIQEVKDFVQSFDYTDSNLFPDPFNGFPQSILKDILNKCDKTKLIELFNKTKEITPINMNDIEDAFLFLTDIEVYPNYHIHAFTNNLRVQIELLPDEEWEVAEKRDYVDKYMKVYNIFSPGLVINHIVETITRNLRDHRITVLDRKPGYLKIEITKESKLNESTEFKGNLYKTLPYNEFAEFIKSLASKSNIIELTEFDKKYIEEILKEKGFNTIVKELNFKSPTSDAYHTQEVIVFYIGNTKASGWIQKLEDDYYAVEIRSTFKHFKCDGLDGLKQFINSEDFAFINEGIGEFTDKRLYKIISMSKGLKYESVNLNTLDESRLVQMINSIDLIATKFGDSRVNINKKNGLQIYGFNKVIGTIRKVEDGYFIAMLSENGGSTWVWECDGLEGVEQVLNDFYKGNILDKVFESNTNNLYDEVSTRYFADIRSNMTPHRISDREKDAIANKLKEIDLDYIYTKGMIRDMIELKKDYPLNGAVKTTYLGQIEKTDDDYFFVSFSVLAKIPLRIYRCDYVEGVIQLLDDYHNDKI